MSVCKFWKDRYDSASAMYKCAACDRELKTKVSKSEKNPDRVFVSCDTKFGGCGLFCFTDEEPKKFAVAKAKQGAVLGGAYAAAPPTADIDIANLKAKVATIESQLSTIFADLEMLQGLQALRVEDDHSDHSNEVVRKKAKKSAK